MKRQRVTTTEVGVAADASNAWATSARWFRPCHAAEPSEGLALRGAKGLAQKLAAGREEAFLARRLVRLCDTAPIEVVGGGDGRAALPTGPGGLLARTRWAGPGAAGSGLFAELGSDAPLRWFATVQAALSGV